MDVFERVILLKQSAVFRSVRTDDLRVLAPYLESQAFVQGDSVFEMGDVANHMYLIESGIVGISMRAREGEKIDLARLGRGECFGEMGLLDELPRSASAEVLADAVLLVLEKQRLHGLIASHPELAQGMLKSLSLKMRDVGEKLRK